MTTNQPSSIQSSQPERELDMMHNDKREEDLEKKKGDKNSRK